MLSTGTPNLRMRCHITIGRATLPISGDKLSLTYLTLSHAKKTLLSHLSWFAGTRIRATLSGRPVHFRRQQLLLPNSVNPRIRLFSGYKASSSKKQKDSYCLLNFFNRQYQLLQCWKFVKKSFILLLYETYFYIMLFLTLYITCEETIVNQFY